MDMDPDAAYLALKSRIETMQELLDSPHPDIEKIEDTLADTVESFEALDGWLKNGGHLPMEWQR
jgi:hypothetical protein